ncbi:hypothetical protein SK128_012512 [Halocaridina rubra]|uniref:GTF3C1 extended winged-helix domain-containing protein n=1 Tax=Halocaridina rubra TaxID=373956 RepID=A0AAN8XL19_HALRR
MIVRAETDEGYPVKMDKKSLYRLLDKLARGGFLKNIKVNLKCGNQVKTLPFVVHPSITFESPHLKSAIEQQKLKFLAMKTETKKESSASSENSKDSVKSKGDTEVANTSRDEKRSIDEVKKTSVDASMYELKQMHKITAKQKLSVAPVPESATDNATVEHPKKVASSRGSLGPKFIRMSEFHDFLFYLVYGYCGQEDLNQEEAWETIAKSCPEAQLENEDLSAYPRIYCPEVSWKMFIPPLPNHMISEVGWAFVCDILLRLPLTVFMRLVNIHYISPEVEEYIAHPLKSNLLLKYLPSIIRQNLLQGRRYVTYIMDLINRLCYVGLTQYGQQVMKEKDQVFIYINSRASLIDTTTSSPGYHQISADKEYVRKEYTFSCIQDVHQYWYDMWTIAMHTPLGGHNCMQGKKITIQILDRKPQIMETIKNRDMLEAPARDNGTIPGDGRGACGLDSALFVHLKRNWSSNYGYSVISKPSALISTSVEGSEKNYEGTMSYTQYLMNTTNPSSDTVSPKHRLAGLRNAKLSVYKPRIGTEGKIMEVSVGLVQASAKNRKRKKEDANDLVSNEGSISKIAPVPSEKRRKPNSYLRELKIRKKSPKKPYYDEEDRAALRRMNKLRVDWSSAEDSFLLLCKVASCFLFPNKRSQMITFSIVRDMLHKRFPEARNKTSRACQRRINYIMKNPTTEYNVSNFLEEVKQDARIVEDFKGTKLPKSKRNVEVVYTAMFKSLMQRLVSKFGSSESRHCPDLPDTIEECDQKFRLIVAASSLRSKLKFHEVTCVSDIDFHVVNSLIYSSLCSTHDRDSYAYQLYLAYQQYPQSLLNSVLRHMRQDQMISYKKCYNRSLFTQSCLPLSMSPFQLSMTYIHVFNTRYQYEIFHQAWQMLKRLYEKEVVLLNKLISVIKSQSANRNSDEFYVMPGPSTVVADDLLHGNTQEAHGKGVPVVILHEGGFCATIVALMATKRLIFDIIIPEQVIMMDQQQAFLEDHSPSLLRRFSSHTEMSGRQIEDLKVPKDSLHKDSASIKNIPGQREIHEETANGVDSDLTKTPVKRKAFGKDSHKVKRSKSIHDEQDSDLDANLPTEEPETDPLYIASAETFKKSNINDGDFVTDIPLSSSGIDMSNDKEENRLLVDNNKEPDETEVDIPKEQNESEESAIQEKGSQAEEIFITGEKSETTVAQGRGNMTSASRLGLYMMRDQLSKAEVDQINIQHAQEHLVVNACDVNCRLRPPPELQESFEVEIPDNPDKVENFLLPLNKQKIAEALECRKKVTLEGWTTLNEIITVWKKEGKSDSFLQLVRDIYEHIASRKEIGASTKELKEKFRLQDRLHIMSIVSAMEGARLLLRVGVAVVRWVTIPHTKPWLIHTNKITR